jgi:hypothetical protein
MRIVELIGTLPAITALSGSALRQYQQQLSDERKERAMQAAQTLLAQRKEQQVRDNEWRKRHTKNTKTPGKLLARNKKAQRSTRTGRNTRQA